MEPRRTARYYYLRFLRLQGDPGFLARGVAVGLFIGVTPTIPLHTVLTLLLAFLFRGSKLAAILAGWLVSNPLTLFFQYYFSYRAGIWLTQSDLSWERISSVLVIFNSHAGFGESLTAFGQLGRDALLVMLSGGFLLSTPIAVAGYFLSLWFFRMVRENRERRRELKTKNEEGT